MKTDKSKFEVVYSGNQFNVDLVYGLLKDNDIKSAVKLSNTDSSFTSLGSDEDDVIYVESAEVDKAKEIIASTNENK